MNQSLISSQKKTRIEWIDLIRALAIICVVFCHSTETIYSLNVEYMLSITTSSRIFALIVFTIGRLGVPLFMMISGYLLLDRKYDEERSRKFWKNNWLHLIICTEIWIVIYNVFLCVYHNQTLNLRYLIEEMLFIRRVNMSHVWYMPMIIGMYLLFPYVANALQSLDYRKLKLPLLFFSMYSFGYPLINMLSQLYTGEAMSFQLSLGFSGGWYGIYFVIGYILKKGAFKKISTKVLICTTMVSFAGAVLLQFTLYNDNYAYNVWYDCPFILICVVGLFELLSRIKKVKCYRVIHFMAYYSFAIYLIHNVVRAVVAPHIESLKIMQQLKIFVLFFVIIIISYLCAIIIKSIPKIGKYILYMK